MNERLFNAAKQALEKAYCPYSKYQVGAALLTDTGEIFSGCNIENASYGLTVCAERVALFKAKSEGYTNIKELVVMIKGDVLPSPCGACRQVIVELAPNAKIVLATNTGKYEIKTVDELLPFSFNKSSLSEV
ncbi:cytidine deaminase [Clostridium sp. 'deep sea']|uniref:cytidine deaminase n=1 Tax=Clostridium sp. 'deep sea' TaxID=2779445 RepID=UPI001896858C|nr:cytidine deaminase [Clostridium sp. 'deep sea']QOR35597.1 cytidine deaminase [Clostridium sp. 'deep sea']